MAARMVVALPVEPGGTTSHHREDCDYECGLRAQLDAESRRFPALTARLQKRRTRLGTREWPAWHWERRAYGPLVSVLSSPPRSFNFRGAERHPKLTRPAWARARLDRARGKQLGRTCRPIAGSQPRSS